MSPLMKERTPLRPQTLWPPPPVSRISAATLPRFTTAIVEAASKPSSPTEGFDTSSPPGSVAVGGGSEGFNGQAFSVSL